MKVNKKISLILILIILFLTGCTTNQQQDLVSKCNEQINYLDTKLFQMANDLNNIPVYNYKVGSNQAKIQEESKQGGSSSQSASGGQSTGGGQAGSGGETGNGSASEQQNQNTITVTQMEPDSILVAEENIDWNSAKVDIESLYETWGTIILDLYKLNLDNNNILGFSTDLDTTTSAIKSENKARKSNSE